jgi:hypothetical protein
VVGAAYQQKDLAAAAPSRFLTAPLLSRADEGPWLWPEIAASRQPVDRRASFDALWLLVFFVRRAALLSLTARRRWEPLRSYGFKSPFASMEPHPSILISRTVAGAASRARMCKDGRWMCLLESMWRRIGWTFASGQRRDLRRHAR